MKKFTGILIFTATVGAKTEKSAAKKIIDRWNEMADGGYENLTIGCPQNTIVLKDMDLIYQKDYEPIFSIGMDVIPEKSTFKYTIKTPPLDKVDL